MSSAHTVNDCVLYNSPRGEDFVVHNKWTGSTTPNVEADPETLYNMRVLELHLLATDDFAPAHKVRITGITDGQSGSTYTDFDDLGALVSLANEVTMYEIASDQYIHMVFKPKPPRKLTDADAETFKVAEDSETETVTGTLWITIIGHTYKATKEGITED